MQRISWEFLFNSTKGQALWNLWILAISPERYHHRSEPLQSGPWQSQRLNQLSFEHQTGTERMDLWMTIFCRFKRMVNCKHPQTPKWDERCGNDAHSFVPPSCLHAEASRCSDVEANRRTAAAGFAGGKRDQPLIMSFSFYRTSTFYWNQDE